MKSEKRQPHQTEPSAFQTQQQEISSDVPAERTQSGQPLTAAKILELQHRHGNDFVRRMIESSNMSTSMVQRIGNEKLFEALVADDEAGVKTHATKHNVDSTNDKWQRPLHIAAENGNVNITRILLGLGADIDASDVKFRTPLLIAVEHGHFNLVQALVELKADINKTNAQYQTPLHLATANGHDVIVQFLVESGADVNRTDNKNRRAMTQQQPTSASSVELHENLPLHVGVRIKNAMDEFRRLDERSMNAHELQRLQETFGGATGYSLKVPLLDRIASQKNTRLQVEGTFAPLKSPADAGGTTLIAKLSDNSIVQDTGFLASEKFPKALDQEANRNQVQFLIKITIMIPVYEHQSPKAWSRSTAHYLETITHELALHGEKYLDVIDDYQNNRSKWKNSFEYQEHYEHLYEGNKRYVLIMSRIINDIKAKKIGRDHGETLLKEYGASLMENVKYLIKREGIKPKGAEHEEKGALWWVEDMLAEDLKSIELDTDIIFGD